MKMSPALEDLFNRQITMEVGASVSYLQMAAFLDSLSLIGMAAWMKIQSEEEKEHAERFIEFTLDRGNDVKIGDIAAPKTDFDGAASVFATALAQEQSVTASITEMYQAAQAEGDITALPLLQEFLTEQVEEESLMEEVLDRLEMAADEGAALLALDQEMGARQPE
jgi:ferritin